MTKLKDSGNRRKFDSGAVRDMAEGKGRCDLLPLDVLLHTTYSTDMSQNLILRSINDFEKTGDETALFAVIRDFMDMQYPDEFTAMLELAKHYEDGAVKYGDDNWKKGIPVSVFIDSGIRHYLKYLRGDNDEPHDRAFLWNMVGAVWTCLNRPELNTYRKSDDDVKIDAEKEYGTAVPFNPNNYKLAPLERDEETDKEDFDLDKFIEESRRKSERYPVTCGDVFGEHESDDFLEDNDPNVMDNPNNV